MSDIRPERPRLAIETQSALSRRGFFDCNNPGVWAFHCHILPHAEGHQGMFGMVNALIVQA